MTQMITDDMVTVKAGVIIAKVKQPGSVVDNLMKFAAGTKRRRTSGISFLSN